MAEAMDSDVRADFGSVRPPITKVYARRKKVEEIINVKKPITRAYTRGKKAEEIVNVKEPKVKIIEIQNLGFDECEEELVGKNRKRTKLESFDINELVVLAASLDHCQELEHGDVIWAKVSGHPMWPSLILDESKANNIVRKLKGLGKNQSDKSFLVQFFGTHEFARVKKNIVKSFLGGLVSGFHLECKKAIFAAGIDEARMYLSSQKLPETMSGPRNGLQSAEDEGKPRKMSRKRCRDVDGYRHVDMKRDLEKCDVCNVDEECENNLFLQCDKCRIMVHARCYGELEASDGALWLCNLCRAGAPAQPPPCCLCPVTGGAKKPTTDGRWAHLACAIWIPETCLADVKKMEPVDGITKINKDRWKLLCSICGVSHGACVQCSYQSCRVAYHPLCARAARFREDVEVKGGCIRLVSFCKKHWPVSGEGLSGEEKKLINFLEYSPPINPSGCARTEPYDPLRRRGRKEPEALSAASMKRLYVENMPHLVGGFTRHEQWKLKRKPCLQKAVILSMSEKYRYMKETVRKRLAFGKSGIHGFGVFAKQFHRAGDMMIEYVGEIVRSSVADRRERMMYNSMVGAGTYMFRVDEERVVDATRAGSMAHLINHSCDPNCYSRMISINGDAHIIIFAKRDIKQWEELTYDYRFYAIDEVLPCYCGVQGCRGVVNDPEAEEPGGKMYVPASQLIGMENERSNKL